MTAVLVRKLLRDLRVTLIVIALLLGAFQVLWHKVVERIVGQLAPFFHGLAGLGGMTAKDVEAMVFDGPGKIIRTLIGGDKIDLNTAADLATIGFVHPLVQTIFCIWAVGRAAGALAGELDRGTMELLLAQPIARFRLLLAHLCVDFITIPVLCLSMWAGCCIGAWAVSPIEPREPEFKRPTPRKNVLIQLGEMWEKSKDAPRVSPAPRTSLEDRLRLNPAAFGAALPVAGGLLFAITGYTMWLSAMGRFRFRVLGIAVLVTLVQFLVNLLGQMWSVLEPLRPLTVFYYYQPQQVMLGRGWCVTLSEWNGGQPLADVPMLAVLFGVGLAGYLLALWTFTRRDLPAPL